MHRCFAFATACLAAFGVLACDTAVDDSPPDDMAALADHGARPDAAGPEDAGAAEDAGLPEDAGIPEDAGPREDGAVERDTGGSADGGGSPDAGTALDVGISAAILGRYVDIPPGTFVMGSPRSEAGRSMDEEQWTVTLSKGFWIKQTEVTRREWRAVMGFEPPDPSNCGDDCPVEGVPWYDATEYMNVLSSAAGLFPCYTDGPRGRTFFFTVCDGFRLPTEAEWEYAARAGTTDAVYGDLDAIAWWSGNATQRTYPVAQRQPNPWGLYDMIGNVEEWTNDIYGEYPTTPRTDPFGPRHTTLGEHRSFRGCSWNSGENQCRAAARRSALFSPNVGLRPVKPRD